MRIAALYDIHGNLPALEAVLDDVRRARVERIVVGGDVVPGPMVRETLGRLRELDVPVDYLYGNCERAVLAEREGRDSGYKLPADARATVRWTATYLDAAEAAFLATWPKTVRIDIDGIGAVLFCHGTPRDENEIFTNLTPEDIVEPMFDGVTAPLVVCGHTHMQFDRTIGRTRIVNAGSVGMPFQDSGAYWLLLGPGVELRYTGYDLDAAATQIRAANYPDAENFATRYVLQPPSSREMLDAFTAFSIRSAAATQRSSGRA